MTINEMPIIICFLKILYKILNKITYFKFIYFFKIDNKQLSCSTDYKDDVEVFSEEDLLNFADMCECDLNKKFVINAIKKGDVCFGIKKGKFLISYAWIANSPTVLFDKCVIYFNRSKYVYLYKTFTIPEFRGMLFNSKVISFSKKICQHKDIILFVDARNINSIRSVKKIGANLICCVIILKIFGNIKFFFSKKSNCGDFSISFISIPL